MYLIVIHTFTKLARIVLASTSREFQPAFIPVTGITFQTVLEARQYAQDHGITLAS